MSTNLKYVKLSNCPAFWPKKYHKLNKCSFIAFINTGYCVGGWTGHSNEGFREAIKYFLDSEGLNAEECMKTLEIVYNR